MKKNYVPQPKNIRKITNSFAWIDHKLARNGFLEVMTLTDMALYLFLVLAADKNGVSFYRKEKICQSLSISFNDFEIAKDRLIAMKLIVFEPYSVISPNGYFQLLQINHKPPDFSREIIGNLTNLFTIDCSGNK